MGKVVTGASIFLDGYISGPNESGFEHLFAWYGAGDLEYPSTHPEVQFRLTASDHRHLKEYVDGVGVLVVGRRLFNLVDGWGGIHPLDRPVVVVTHRVPDDWVRDHPDAPFTFVTDGLPSAIDRARQIAGERNIGVTVGTLASQCLELGLVDEVWFDLVPWSSALAHGTSSSRAPARSSSTARTSSRALGSRTCATSCAGPDMGSGLATTPPTGRWRLTGDGPFDRQDTPPRGPGGRLLILVGSPFRSRTRRALAEASADGSRTALTVRGGRSLQPERTRLGAFVPSSGSGRGHQRCDLRKHIDVVYGGHPPRPGRRAHYERRAR